MQNIEDIERRQHMISEDDNFENCSSDYLENFIKPEGMHNLFDT